MEITLVQPDGLHISSQATLSELPEVEIVREYADGLIVQALTEVGSEATQLTVTEGLRQGGEPALAAWSATLLALDAVITAFVAHERLLFPVAGYLSYYNRLPLDQYPLNTLRLPPLNPGGHYHLNRLGPAHYLVVRLDLHPLQKMAGHVRLVVVKEGALPRRVNPIEERLDRHFLDEAYIDTAVAAGADQLAKSEQTALKETLQRIVATAPEA